MMDAITNLGGGGLSSPWLANLANCLNYVMSFLTTLFGGPLINKFGIKWSCMIAAVTYPLYASAFYVNVTRGIDWYLLLSNVHGPHPNPDHRTLLIRSSLSWASPQASFTSPSRRLCFRIRRQNGEAFTLVRESTSLCHESVALTDIHRHLVRDAELRQRHRWRHQLL